ncbi:hypothetical protein F4861DRAFT_528693 [Xylaria intraflava]|nr:hypothetical protein F4861DRAFT_528693 [Xylaria intraflava]
MRKTCQEALTDKQTLQVINEELIEKQKKQRKSGKKGFGEAKVLSLGEMKKKKAEKDAAEKEKMSEKALKAALYGKGKLAKLAWKELPMEPFLLGSWWPEEE